MLYKKIKYQVFKNFKNKIEFILQIFKCNLFLLVILKFKVKYLGYNLTKKKKQKMQT